MAGLLNKLRSASMVFNDLDDPDRYSFITNAVETVLAVVELTAFSNIVNRNDGVYRVEVYERLMDPVLKLINAHLSNLELIDAGYPDDGNDNFRFLSAVAKLKRVIDGLEDQVFGDDDVDFHRRLVFNNIFGAVDQLLNAITDNAILRDYLDSGNTFRRP